MVAIRLWSVVCPSYIVSHILQRVDSVNHFPLSVSYRSHLHLFHHHITSLHVRCLLYGPPISAFVSWQSDSNKFLF